jgi:RNA-directed DNA polymerase
MVRTDSSNSTTLPALLFAKGVSIKTTMEELATYMRGWRGYFGFCQTPEVLIALTRWVRSMENTTASPRGSCRKWGFGMGCKEHGRERPRSLVSRPKPGPLHWALKCLLKSLGLPSLFQAC